MDICQSKALESWYKEDNPLRLELRHPLIKLAGEAGELLDLFGKNEYKPNFNWWKCKKCGFIPMEKGTQKDYVAYTCFNGDRQHNSLVLDELGDWWYYFRIVCFIAEKEIVQVKGEEYPFWEIDKLLAVMAENSCVMLNDYLDRKWLDTSRLRILWGCFEGILDKLDYTIDDLTELNYKKLNSEPTQHGWSSAREIK